jgi:hypothetical protein
MTLQTTSPKRSVRFEHDDNLCVYHAGAVMDIEEACRRDIWHQHTDLQHFKRKAMMTAKEATRYGLGTLLTNTYGKACNDTQEAINSWARNGSNRRGLERWINNEYAAKRSDIRRRTIKSVLRAQRKMREEGVADPEYTMKVLSRLSEAFSQDSRNFARVLGKGDEHAVVVDSEPAEVCESKERKAPRRQPSPSSVGFHPQFASKRNLQLNSHANDMRHFY